MLQINYISTDINDCRVIHLKITDDANDAINSIIKEHDQFLDTLFSGFTEKEKETWQFLEKKLSVNIENALRKKA